MSNTDKSVAAKPGTVITRWWWVRHAPVREDNGCIYGQQDLGCDTSDREVFEAVGKILPRDAVWIATTLKRTHQTADAIWAAGYPKPQGMPHIKDLAEQHLGEWQGMHRATFLASRPAGSNWFAEIDEPAPGGESFMDLYRRVTATIERFNLEHAGRNIIAVAHGGVIKAALGLALGGLAGKGLDFDIDNCSVTRLDHFASPGPGSIGHSNWRLPMVNQQPWMADAAHNAMHQPAGPEIATSKLA
jgi:alpha-ribazole phosphatase